MRAAELAHALGGWKVGQAWAARCPAHDDRRPSLSIRDAADGKLLVHCFAGCTQAQVISALQDRGLWPTNHRHHDKTIRPKKPRSTYDQPGRKGTEAASRIWQSAKPAPGTLVEVYLQARDICTAPPPTLRFDALKHPSGSIWPTMIALLTRGTDGASQAIHRTFLSLDGTAKAPVDPQKMMLGPCCGGAVRLAEARDLLMVGEGIETCLAAMQATGNPTWAALSTSGLRSLDLPSDVRDVIVLADGDDPGEAAARDCARRWRDEGRRVRIARPPQGMDFNDMLRGKAPASVKERAA